MSFELSEPLFCFTCDIDWNNNNCIKTALDIFEKYNVKLTVFSTHKTSIFENYQNLQIGIHPNFLPGSSHGKTINEVIEHMFGLYPNAETFRSHSYYDNQYLTEIMAEKGIKYDSNLCLYLQQGIIPLHTGHGIIRFPVFFEDSIHWYNNGEWDFDILKEQLTTPGLKIFNFHPYPVALNIPSRNFYDSKRNIFHTIAYEEIYKHRYPGKGPLTFLENLLEFVTKNPYSIYSLQELYYLYVSQKQRPIREIAGRPPASMNYERASEESRLELVREQYQKMDATNIYATSRDWNLRELEIHEIKKHLDSGSILDLGCGNGYTLLSIAKSLRNAQLTGVDFSSNMIEGAMRLKRNMNNELLSEPEFICEDIFNFIERKHSLFDYIITERLIVNLPTAHMQWETIEKIIGLLKLGGKYIMVEGSKQGFQKLNIVRKRLGLEEIPDVYPGNESSKKIDIEILRKHLHTMKVHLECEKFFSFYNLATKVLHPLFVAPDEPKFSSKINALSRHIHQVVSDLGLFEENFGAGFLWVIRKR